MSIYPSYKLQNLEKNWLNGIVVTSTWLDELGISSSLMNRYKKSKWVESVGYGAFKRFEEKIEWYGGLHALQQQLEVKIHVGGKTALEIHGLSHYLSLGKMTIDLLKAPKTIVPQWFLNYKWAERIRLFESNLLPPDIGIVDSRIENILIRVSSRERAALELVHLAPRIYAFDEVPILMDSLASLRGDKLNELLQQCTSEKVKRLILYFGEKQQHSWYKDINQEALSIGNEPLKIVPNNGKYISKYKILIPKDYEIKDESEILY